MRTEASDEARGGSASGRRFPSPFPANWRADAIDPDSVGTLDGLFRERARRTPQATAYQAFDTARQVWRDHTWAEMAGL